MTKRELINFLFAGPLSKDIAGVRPLTNKERRALLRLIYAGAFAWLWQLYQNTKLEEEMTNDIVTLSNQLVKEKENVQIYSDSDQKQRDKKVALIHFLKNLKVTHPELASEIDPIIEEALR